MFSYLFCRRSTTKYDFVRWFRSRPLRESKRLLFFQSQFPDARFHHGLTYTWELRMNRAKEIAKKKKRKTRKHRKHIREIRSSRIFLLNLLRISITLACIFSRRDVRRIFTIPCFFSFCTNWLLRTMKCHRF